ncbi:MAG: DUF1320 family protein [Lentimicrobium sp.]|jgi:phage gp36-like protein|nr:DUF1320 family protein [Lentimicrobium sp.]
MLVSIEELGQTSLYPEIITKITRGNEESAVLQIMAAESLVKSYMSKFNIDAIFGTETVEPTHPDEHIKKLVKIIASYYLVRRSNPGVDIELFRADYEDAIDWLKDLQAGRANPNLPALDSEEKLETGVSWSSNKKRTNHF